MIPLLLLAVYLLPPDTSLRQVRELGVLRACVPNVYPPLVTPRDAQPGIDVEILRSVAAELGVRLSLNHISTMGRDFNPRNWRLTRAQCHVIAGGMIDSPTTRSFLDVTPSYLTTGWALVGPIDSTELEGALVGFYSGVTALDRIALGRALRSAGARVETVHEIDDLVNGVQSGRLDAGVTEALLARQLALDHGWNVFWVPGLERFPIVLGLWKGDLTLKRRLVGAFEALERDGTLERILARYELKEISSSCLSCEFLRGGIIAIGRSRVVPVGIGFPQGAFVPVLNSCCSSNPLRRSQAARTAAVVFRQAREQDAGGGRQLLSRPKEATLG